MHKYAFQAHSEESSCSFLASFLVSLHISTFQMFCAHYSAASDRRCRSIQWLYWRHYYGKELIKPTRELLGTVLLGAQVNTSVHLSVSMKLFWIFFIVLYTTWAHGLGTVTKYSKSIRMYNIVDTQILHANAHNNNWLNIPFKTHVRDSNSVFSEVKLMWKWKVWKNRTDIFRHFI